MLCFLLDTAYAKNSHNSKWYHFDDSHVSETDESHLVVSSVLYCVCLSVCVCGGDFAVMTGMNGYFGNQIF